MTDEFHNEVLPAGRLLHSIYGRNARMIQHGKNSSLALESCGAIGIVSEGFRQQFDRHAAAELGIRGLVHLSHAARSQVTGDFKMR